MAKEKEEITIHSSAAEYLTYVAAIGDQQDEDSIEMRYEDENIWLTQKMMATLYDVSVAAINQHIKKVYDDSELEPVSTIKKYLIVQTRTSYSNDNGRLVKTSRFIPYGRRQGNPSRRWKNYSGNCQIKSRN